MLRTLVCVALLAVAACTSRAGEVAIDPQPSHSSQVTEVISQLIDRGWFENPYVNHSEYLNLTQVRFEAGSPGSNLRQLDRVVGVSSCEVERQSFDIAGKGAGIRTRTIDCRIIEQRINFLALFYIEHGTFPVNPVVGLWFEPSRS